MRQRRAGQMVVYDFRITNIITEALQMAHVARHVSGEEAKHYFETGTATYEFNLLHNIRASQATD